MAGSWGDQISATKIVICTCLHMMAIPLAHPNPSGRGCQKQGLGRSGGQASWVTDNDYIPSLLHLSFWGVMDTLISSQTSQMFPNAVSHLIMFQDNNWTMDLLHAESEGENVA